MLNSEFRLNPTARLYEAIVAPDDSCRCLFLDATYGEIVAALMRDAQRRGVLTEVTFDSFSDEHDSDGREWGDLVCVHFARGITYGAALKSLGRDGTFAFKLLYPSGDLRLFKRGWLREITVDGMPQ